VRYQAWYADKGGDDLKMKKKRHRWTRVENKCYIERSIQRIGAELWECMACGKVVSSDVLPSLYWESMHDKDECLGSPDALQWQIDYDLEMEAMA